MVSIKVRDKNGKEIETLELEDALFGKFVNQQLLHDAILMYEANKRQGTVSTKVRSEVIGSGRKPWRQKGTGRARAGTAKSPLWRKGGVTFGPKPRDYSYSLPKKALRKALSASLLAKIRKSKLHLIDNLNLEKPKTKEMAELLGNLGLKESTTIVVGPTDMNAYLSGRNLSKISVCKAEDLNARDVVLARNLLVTKEAFEIIKKRTSSEKKGGAL